MRLKNLLAYVSSRAIVHFIHLHIHQALHSEVLDPLLVLLAIALELPEDYFTKLHQYQVKSEVCAPSLLCLRHRKYAC